MLSRKNAMAKKIEYLKTEAIKNPETSSSKLLTIIQKDLRLKEHL